jgi:hypothetical protein
MQLNVHGEIVRGVVGFTADVAYHRFRRLRGDANHCYGIVVIDAVRPLPAAPSVAASPSIGIF